MVNSTKSINGVEKIVVDPTKVSMEKNVHRRIVSDIKSSEIDADTNRHRFKREDLDNAVEVANKVVSAKNERFEFKIHERTGRMMVKLIDKETDEIVKEIPQEKMLDLVASIWDLVGILVDERG